MRVDKEVLDIFDEDFLTREMTAHGVDTIRMGKFSDEMNELLGDGQPMFALPKSKTICIRSDTDWESARKTLNQPCYPGNTILSNTGGRSYATPLRLETGQEAKAFIFFHEAFHILHPDEPEWRADQYARQRVIEMRGGKIDW